jgi:hypothetical protein
MCLHDEEPASFRKTSKETVEALAREGPRQGKDVAGLP